MNWLVTLMCRRVAPRWNLIRRPYMRFTGHYIFWLAILPALWSTHPLAAQKHPSTDTFLIVSDLHFNPMADPSLVSALAAADSTKWETVLNRSKPSAFSQYGEDTNWWLLRSSLDAMRTSLPHPAFILVTGDLLAHRFPEIYKRTRRGGKPEDYRQFVFKTVEFLALQFRKRFPETKVLLTPGNNDDDCGDYAIEAGGPFLRDTADAARKLAHADDELRGSWEKLGSYDVPHPAIRDARIISLNSVFFSAKYQPAEFNEGCAAVPSSAAAALFTWLDSRLNRAQREHQKVWLMFHIPPGMDGYSSIQHYRSQLKESPAESPAKVCASTLVPMWLPKWTEQYAALLEKYRDTIVATFAGHTHSDDFRVINSASTHPAFVLINPPISPIYNQNPAFRVATFTKDGSIADESVYYLANLLFASSTTPGEWKREYTFSQAWKMQGVNGTTLSELYNKVERDDAARAQWLKLYTVSSSAAYLPANSISGLSCAIEGLTPQQYGTCYCPAEASGSIPPPASPGK